jgi:malic enzyme
MVAVTVSAHQVRGLPISALRKQRIVVVGAGSAGMGVVRMIAQGTEAP